MMNRQITTGVMAYCVSVLAAAVVGAPANVLHVIPGDALGFVVIQRMQETNAKVQALSERTQLPMLRLLTAWKARVGPVTGVDRNGNGAVVLMPGRDDVAPPVALLLVPVTRYDEFVAAHKTGDEQEQITPLRLGSLEVVSGHVRGYAIVTKRAHREVLQRVLKSPSRGLPRLALWEKWLGETDAAVVVLRPGIRAMCHASRTALQLAELPWTAEELGATLAGGTQDAQRRKMESAKAMLGLIKKVPEFVAREVDAYAATVTMNQDGSMHVTERVRLEPNGKLAKVLHGVRGRESDALFGLPTRPIVVAKGGVTTEETTAAAMACYVRLAKESAPWFGLPEEQLAEMQEAFAPALRRIRGLSMMLCAPKPNQPILSNMMFVIRVDDASGYFDDYKKGLVAIRRLANDSNGSILSTIQLEDIELSGRPGLKVSMESPSTRAAKLVPALSALAERVWGPDERFSVYLALANEQTVVASYVSRDLAVDSLRVVRGTSSGLADELGLAETAAQLPSGTAWRSYVSPKGILSLAREVIRLLPAEYQPPFELREFPRTPPIGVAVEVDADGVHFHYAIPSQTLSAIGEYVTR